MKIGLLTQYYRPEMGAPQNRLYEMIRGLQKLGNEVIVITGMPNYPTGSIFPAYKHKLHLTEYEDNIEINRYWLFASNSNKIIPRIWNMLSFSISSFFSLSHIRKKKLDFLIVETPPLTLGWTGRWLAKLSGVNFVLNVSDLWPLSAKELGAIGEGFIYNCLEKLENYLYRKANIVLGQSEEIVNYIEKHGGQRTFLFRNGVDPTRFVFSKNKNDNTVDSFKIVYAGLLGFAQGIYDLIKNIDFKKLNVEFHIYGDGGEKKLIVEYLELNPDKNIFYHGVVPRDKLPNELIKYDLTLIPLIKNIYGAVPSKIYDAMAAGLPILFMGEGEGVKIIEENKVGLTAHSKNYEELIANIYTLQFNPDLITKMAIRCKDAANNKFNRPKQIVDLNNYLKSFLDNENKKRKENDET